MIELLSVLGDDLMVANCARVSMSKWHSEFDQESDTRLIKYLARNGHISPFFHPHVQLRIEAPIFVARQWFRHVVGTARNEVSRRYVDSPPEFFVPDEWRSRPEQSIKQGSGKPVDEYTSSMAYRYYDLALDAAQEAYRYLLEAGIAPEQARMVLPQSMMTQWIETGSLYFWANFCRQRLDSHAQAEIREYAEQIGAIIAPRFPASWAALMGDPYA